MCIRDSDIQDPLYVRIFIFPGNVHIPKFVPGLKMCVPQYLLVQPKDAFDVPHYLRTCVVEHANKSTLLVVPISQAVRISCLEAMGQVSDSMIPYAADDATTVDDLVGDPFHQIRQSGKRGGIFCRQETFVENHDERDVKATQSRGKPLAG